MIFSRVTTALLGVLLAISFVSDVLFGDDCLLMRELEEESREIEKTEIRPSGSSRIRWEPTLTGVLVAELGEREQSVRVLVSLPALTPLPLCFHDSFFNHSPPASA